MTTAILAGGAASRLGGVDKGLVVLHGRPLIAWVVESLGSGADDPCLIVANRNIPIYSQFAPTISDHASGDFAGPLAGIAVALEACETDWLFTVPVDCMQVPRGLAAVLLGHAVANGACAVVAHDGQRRQPLFGVYRRGLAESAKAALAEGSGAFRWQQGIGARERDCSDIETDWVNLNTNEELSKMALRLGKHE